MMTPRSGRRPHGLGIVAAAIAATLIAMPCAAAGDVASLAKLVSSSDQEIARANTLAVGKEMTGTIRAGGPLVFDGGTPDLENGYNISFYSSGDDFTLSSATTLESARLWSATFTTPWTGNGNYFIYADSGGAPGALAASGSLVNVSSVDTGQLILGAYPLYEHVSDLSPAPSLPAGTYWLAVNDDSACSGAESRFWATTNSGSGNSGLQGGTCGGIVGGASIDDNLAFQLFGPSCVEELFGTSTNGASAPSSLYAVDPVNGASTLIGATGFRRVGSLAFDNDGDLFGIGERNDGSGTDVLIAIDTATGVGTEVGPLGVPTGSAFGEMSFRPSDGALFAYDVSNNPSHRLFTVNPTTGAATLVGTSGFGGTGGNGMAFDDTDSLYMSNGNGGFVNLRLFNQLTGAASTVGPIIGVPTTLGGMDFRNSTGQMYATTGNINGAPSTLGILDLDTRVFTPLGVNGAHLDGLAWRHCGGAVVDPCDDDTVDPVIEDCPSSFTTSCNTEGGYEFYYEPIVTETCPYSVDQSWENPLPFGENEVTVTVTDQAGNSDSCTFTVTVVPDPKDPIRSFSIAAQDGWVRETDYVHGIEGPVNSKAATFDVGDDAANWGKRGILAFNTGGIPEDATITRAAIRLTRSSLVGNTGSLGALHLDMKDAAIVRAACAGCCFGYINNSTLESMDYDTTEGLALAVESSFPAPGGNGFTTFVEIDPAYFDSIDRFCTTQFRVRFSNDSDDDGGADYLVFHSGEAGATVRPELIVEYYTDSCTPCADPSPCGGPVTVTLWSTPLEDGGLQESHWTSEVGGTAGVGSTSSPVGDTSARLQLQLLLNFDTSAIPADAEITSAELRVYRASATGSWSAFGPLHVGMRPPCAMPWWFGGSGALEIGDFQAVAPLAPVGLLTIPATNTYTATLLNAAGLAAINKGGATQMKLFYPVADDGDAVSDQVQIGTGNYGSTSPGRPRLVVTYNDGCGGGT